jgi:outer membrane protein assembly factor BamA
MRPSNHGLRSGVFALVLALAAGIAPCAAADKSIPPSRAAEEATLKVSGVGLLRDRELRRSLLLLLGNQRGPTFDANAIEDASVMLVSALGEEGYQRPVVEIQATLTDGTLKRHVFDASFETSLPRPLEVRMVEFRVTPGIRWYVDSVAFTGLRALPVKAARPFFRSEAMLFVLAKQNAYSPSHVENAAGKLLGELRRLGYAEAVVRVETTKIDELSGAVALLVAVEEGALWKVGAVGFDGANAEPVSLPAAERWIGQTWSPALQEDLRNAVARAFYEKGYPDVVVRLVSAAGAMKHGQKAVTISVRIKTGVPVKIGEIRFVGNAITRDSMLRRAVQMQPGQPLNPIELAGVRYRISRLGVFDTVDLGYEPADGRVRDPVFTLKESERYEASLLMGYGSYEQLRGGIELRQRNLFGRAHQSRLLLVQSMKSASGDYTYSVPELFGELIDGAAKVFAFQRKEVAFLRQEFGASFTLKRRIPWLRAEGTLGYTVQALRDKNNTLATQAIDKEQMNVASVDVGLSSDHRDNPMRPRNGFRWFSQLELASRNLGGVAEYQRLELGAAYHTPLGDGRWIHMGCTHGVIAALGSTDATVPVNKLFFPGGDNSIRGYQKGEAAPRGTDGLFLGAKSYLILNVEVEQALTADWSVVALVDALGSAAQLKDYPFSKKLYSAGLGVRYQTLIGPIRAEYGRNINPRLGDPKGTLLISIGYPF